jgi:hypothetical protein
MRHPLSPSSCFSQVSSAEATFARRVAAKLASIEDGIAQGLPLVNLQTLIQEAHLLGVNKGRLDQLERDVRSRDRAAAQELQEAARSGSFRGSGGFEEAVRKARGFGLWDEVDEAEELMNLRRERVLEGLTRVIELQLGSQEDLTRLVSEAVRLDMADAGKAAEDRWEEQVKERVSEISQAGKTGSRAQFAALVRGLQQRGRVDGLEAAKEILRGRLLQTQEGLAAAADRGSKVEIEKWVKEARELHLVGEVREAKKVQARRLRVALETFKIAVRQCVQAGHESRGAAVDTTQAQAGKPRQGEETVSENAVRDRFPAGHDRHGAAIDTLRAQAGNSALGRETVSAAERAALALAVSETLLAKLRAAVERQESVRRCRQAGGVGGVYARGERGHPTEKLETTIGGGRALLPRRHHDVIIAALSLGSRGEHQFLANAPSWCKGGGERYGDGRAADGSADARTELGGGLPSEGLRVLGAGGGVPIWPYCMDWAEVERLRVRWQTSEFSELISDAAGLPIRSGSETGSQNGLSSERGSEKGFPDGLREGNERSGAEERDTEESDSSEEEGAAEGGLRSRKSQAALGGKNLHCEERLGSHQEASTSGRETGPSLTRALLEAAAGGALFWSGLQTLDLALEGLGGLGPKGQLAKWCPNLRSVRLDVNRLTTLEGGLEGLEKTLEALRVRDNHLTSFRGLEKLSGLQVLRLDANLIKRVSLDPRLGQGCQPVKGNARAGPHTDYVWPMLTELGLSANRITRVQGLGEACGNLEVLELAGNGVQRFEGMLCDLSRLRVLDVARNR